MDANGRKWEKRVRAYLRLPLSPEAHGACFITGAERERTGPKGPVHFIRFAFSARPEMPERNASDA